jgi:hypothetical protein
MPVTSQAQRRFMYATAEGKTNVAPSVGKEFVTASKGIKDLPERVGPKKRIALTRRLPTP